MNYFNTSDFDYESWIEIEKKLPRDDIDIVTGHSVKAEIDLAKVALGLPSPESAENKGDKEYSYFITCAFPTNHRFKIKHLELLANNRSRIVFSPIKYGDCTQDEQYQFIKHKLTNHFHQVADFWDIFYEQTLEGNVHFHGRIGYNGKKKTMKDIKALTHRIFELDNTNKRFMDVKPYDANRWNNYETKEKKSYQTMNYPHYIVPNIYTDF